MASNQVSVRINKLLNSLFVKFKQFDLYKEEFRIVIEEDTLTHWVVRNCLYQGANLLLLVRSQY